MRIDIWLGFPAEARPDRVHLPEISLGLVFQATYCLRYCVTPACSLMFRCSALNIMLCAFMTLIVGLVHGSVLVVGPASMAVCASGLWYGLWVSRPWHVYALWLVIFVISCFTYYVFHVTFLWHDGLLLLVALCNSCLRVHSTTGFQHYLVGDLYTTVVRC